MRALQEFTKTDWYGFSGCEPGPMNEQPQVAYDDDAVVIVDGTGVGVILASDIEFKLDVKPFALAVYIASYLPAPSADLPKSQQEMFMMTMLTKLGFERIGG